MSETCLSGNECRRRRALCVERRQRSCRGRFLDKRIKFTDIAKVVAHCLAQDFSDGRYDIEGLLAQDANTQTGRSLYRQTIKFQ